MANLPTFAAGEYYKIQAAVDSGVLKYPSYVYIRDEKKLAFIDQDFSVNRIVGDNKQSVVNVSELPSVDDAETDVLYIFEGIVYLFDGTELKPIYKDVTGVLPIEISIQDYNNLSEEERKDKLFFITDDDNGLYCPPLIQFERNEDDNGVVIKVTNYDGTISTSVIFDGSIENIRDEIEDTLGDNAATDEDIDSLFP